MSEANMLVKINETITEETTFDNSYPPDGAVFCQEVLDDGTSVQMCLVQKTLIYELISEFGIIPSQETKFARLAWNRIVELKKIR